MISFDGKNERLGLSRLADGPVTIPVVSRYGFVFMRERGGLTVLHTLPGSIAERSVISEGERITKLLGIPVTQYSDEQIIGVLRDRDTIHMTVDRGGFPLLVPLNAQ